MSQTWLGSLVEAKTNIAVGFTVNWCANMVVLPWFGFDVTAGQAFGIGLVFTAISLARQYAIRRWFNGMKWDKERPASAPQIDPVPQIDRRPLPYWRNHGSNDE